MADFPCLLAILNTLKIFRFEKVPRSFNYEVFEVSPEAEEVYVCYEYRKSFQVFEMIKGKYPGICPLYAKYAKREAPPPSSDWFWRTSRKVDFGWVQSPLYAKL